MTKRIFFLEVSYDDEVAGPDHLRAESNELDGNIEISAQHLLSEKWSNCLTVRVIMSQVQTS